MIVPPDRGTHHLIEVWAAALVTNGTARADLGMVGGSAGPLIETLARSVCAGCTGLGGCNSTIRGIEIEVACVQPRMTLLAQLADYLTPNRTQHIAEDTSKVAAGVAALGLLSGMFVAGEVLDSMQFTYLLTQTDVAHSESVRKLGDSFRWATGQGLLPHSANGTGLAIERPLGDHAANRTRGVGHGAPTRPNDHPVVRLWDSGSGPESGSVLGGGGRNAGNLVDESVVGGSVDTALFVNSLIYSSVAFVCVCVLRLGISMVAWVVCVKIRRARRRKRPPAGAYSPMAALRFPRTELIMLVVLYQGVAISTLPVFRSNDAVLISVATAVLVLVLLPVPAVMFVFLHRKISSRKRVVWYTKLGSRRGCCRRMCGLARVFTEATLAVFRIRVGNVTVSAAAAPLKRQDAKVAIKRTESSQWLVPVRLVRRFSRGLSRAKTRYSTANVRGSWGGDGDFITKYDFLFTDYTRASYAWAPIDLTIKLVRAAAVGLLVGILDGKLQIVFVLVLQGARLLWLIFRGSSSSRVKDLVSIVSGTLETTMMALCLLLPETSFASHVLANLEIDSILIGLSLVLVYFRVATSLPFAIKPLYMVLKMVVLGVTFQASSIVRSMRGSSYECRGTDDLDLIYGSVSEASSSSSPSPSPSPSEPDDAFDFDPISISEDGIRDTDQ
jgi:hypothetical protein